MSRILYFVFKLIFPLATLILLYYVESLFSVLKEDKVDVVKWRTYTTSFWNALVVIFINSFISTSARASSSIKFCKTCASKR